jgi:hypothetical protein
MLAVAAVFGQPSIRPVSTAAVFAFFALGGRCMDSGSAVARIVARFGFFLPGLAVCLSVARARVDRAT